VTPLVQPATPPRMFTCHKCGRFVLENKFGDFEKGVRCPFCNAKNYAPASAPVPDP
jgi:DNA-directed RNA polymerase subunit RPC12/RpoP